MGMYTEMMFGARVKDQSVWPVIEGLVSGYWGNTPIPDHPFFTSYRGMYCLRSGGSYYFGAQPYREFSSVDDITECRTLTFNANIKNYDHEWEKFLDWIAPYLDEQDGYDPVAYIRYEDSAYPTCMFVRDGKVLQATPVYTAAEEVEKAWHK